MVKVWKRGKNLSRGMFKEIKDPVLGKSLMRELHAVNRQTFVRLLTTGDDTWKDYTLEFDVKPLKKHGRGWDFHCRADSGNLGSLL